MLASDIEKIALKEVGVYETYNNNVKYNTWYYGRQVNGDYPWCMVFVQWVFTRCGNPLPCRTASCGTLMNYAKKNGSWVTENFRRGDVMIMTTKYGRHTGIILDGNDRGTVKTIEGNTSDKSVNNGGQVMIRNRTLNILGAYRPIFEDEVENMTEKELRLIIDDEIEKVSKRIESLPPSDWSDSDRAWAENKKLIVGDGNKMRYKSPITREEMCSFFHRFSNLK